MPFIWDDIVWKLIDDEDLYDKSRFVVVRKLHIKQNTEPWQMIVSKFIKIVIMKIHSLHSIDEKN